MYHLKSNKIYNIPYHTIPYYHIGPPEVRSQKSEILFEHIYIYENIKHLYIYYFQTLNCIENIHV